MSCAGKLSRGRANLAKKRVCDSTREEEEARARARLLEGGRAVALGSTASLQCCLQRYGPGSLELRGSGFQPDSFELPNIGVNSGDGDFYSLWSHSADSLVV